MIKFVTNSRDTVTDRNRLVGCIYFRLKSKSIEPLGKLSGSIFGKHPVASIEPLEKLSRNAVTL